MGLSPQRPQQSWGGERPKQHRSGESRVTKKDIIEIVSQKTNLNKNHTKAIIECVLDVFIETLSQEGRIEVRNFGVFKMKRTPARVGRNPVTKESADVPARNIVQFKAGKYMKERVAKADL
jgi:DNA-binding protein HU-beta/integration host factor subunit beta